MKREEKIYPVADAETLIGFRRGAKTMKAKVGEKGRPWEPWEPWEPVPEEADATDN